MARKTNPRPTQESFWNEKSSVRFSSKKSLFVKDLLNSIDETADFHDPFSELNLFLSQKVKQEMRHCGNSKKWSVKLQDELLLKITPEFQQKFPQYRLGISALKKTWEKVAFYSQQIQHQKEALTQAGKLNISFFIKENLKSLPQLKNTCHIHPYHFAHQLALKMSECIATVDGVRPKLEELTQMIWSIQRHLIPNLNPQHYKSPYDEYSKIDKLIVKTILEISAKNPQIAQKELSYQVKEALQYLHDLPAFTSMERLTSNLSALLAEKLYPSLPFHTQFSTDDKQALLHSLKEQIALYQKMEHPEIIRQIMTHCTLNCPLEQLEIILWKIISETEGILEGLPYRIGQKIEEEIATILIDDPHLNFSQVIAEVVSFFKKIKELSLHQNINEIDSKIHVWTMQSDMLLRWVHLNHEMPLLKLITQKSGDLKNQALLSYEQFVSEICQAYLQKYPRLAAYALQITSRIWTLFKYTWYTHCSRPEESSFDRFLKWHGAYLLSCCTDKEQTLKQLEQVCRRMLPLVPFDQLKAQSLLNK